MDEANRAVFSGNYGIIEMKTEIYMEDDVCFG